MTATGFKTYHPIVNLIYFLFAIFFSMFFMNPISLAISLLCSFAYSAMLRGFSAVGKSMLFLLPLACAAAVINTAFSHEGITIITYLPSGNPLTAESIVFGATAAVMLINAILWFSCLNEIMTSDKYIYLFGRIIPSLSLVLSMTLRFVPKFKRQLKNITDAQRCIGKSISSGNILRRAKNGLAILSIMTSWALENAADTADSMKSRGFGLPKRTSFSIFSFDKRDAFAAAFIVSAGIYTVIGYAVGGMYFRYFPSIKYAEPTPYNISIFFAYLSLCAYPIITELVEERKWNVTKSKI